MLRTAMSALGASTASAGTLSICGAGWLDLEKNAIDLSTSVG
jgi:hypothetical protein